MAKPKKEYRITRIVVEGKGHFPLDMLRYDSCVPATGEDASAIERDDHRELRRVKLNRFSFEAHKAEAGRWASFGWRVIEDNGSV